MEFWISVAIAATMIVVTGLVGFVGYHAGKRQGAKFELESSREALDLRVLSIKGRADVERYFQTKVYAEKAKTERKLWKAYKFNTREQYKQ